MKILLLNSQFILSFIGRKKPINENLILTLRNEMTNEVLTPIFTLSYNEQSIFTITFDELTDFKLQEKYEVLLKNDEVTIYRGKLLILDENTNIQDYNYGSQSNSKFKFA